ncbi:hypothetical protein [Kaistia hirudinis]|uniref:hypothetical protein n=1 Tax=Kaistia hirudinis TaxID=1293440 RepID=UPI0036D20FAD
MAATAILAADFMWISRLGQLGLPSVPLSFGRNASGSGPAASCGRGPDRRGGSAIEANAPPRCAIRRIARGLAERPASLRQPPATGFQETMKLARQTEPISRFRMGTIRPGRSAIRAGLWIHAKITNAMPRQWPGQIGADWFFQWAAHAVNQSRPFV